MTGGRLGNWILGEERARGPLGVIYRAQDGQHPERIAAVTVLTPDPSRSPDFLQKFPSEMLFLQRLNHPNIARFYDSGVAAGVAYYAWEWVDGQDLATVLKQRSRRPEEPGLSWKDELFRLAASLTRALIHGHHRSILHRGLKPACILIAPDGSVKVTEFGVGKVLGQPPLSLAADPWGLAGYMAPEYFTGKPYTKRSDLYALGGILYTIVTGRPPFVANSAAEFMHKHCYTLPERPSQLVPKLPIELDELICALLAKDANRRPTSAVMVLEELDRIRGKLERKGITVIWPVDPGDRAEPPTPADGSPTIGESDDYPAYRPLLSRPAVVIPAFLVVIGLILLGLFWPHPGPEELYAAAVPLLNSDDPADWDRAWDEYLEPLSRRYPNALVAERTAAVQHIADRRELHRALEAGAKSSFTSEAHRWYAHGLALARVGDEHAAYRVWTEMLLLFSGSENPGDERWLALARLGLAGLPQLPPETTSAGKLSAVFQRLKDLESAGRHAEAEAIRAALGDLYRDDPKTLAKLRASP